MTRPTGKLEFFISFVQRYRECERNAGVQWSIDFTPPDFWGAGLGAVFDDIVMEPTALNVRHPSTKS